MVEIFDPQARLEHIIQVALAAKRFSQPDKQGSLAFFPRSMEFYHEGLFASGIFSLKNEKKTILIFFWEWKGYVNIWTTPLLGRKYPSKKSDFEFCKEWFKKEITLDIHYELLFPYLQLLKNITEIVLIQITKSDIELFWQKVTTTILEEYNLIFCEDLHNKVPLEEGLEKDSELLKSIRENHKDSLSQEEFPLLWGFWQIRHHLNLSIINEQYLNTGILGLDKKGGSGYGILNAW